MGNLNKPSEAKGSVPTADNPILTMATGHDEWLWSGVMLPEYVDTIVRIANGLNRTSVVELRHNPVGSNPFYQGIEHNTPGHESTADTSSMPRSDQNSLDTILKTFATRCTAVYGHDILNDYEPDDLYDLLKPAKDELNAWHQQQTIKELEAIFERYAEIKGGDGLPIPLLIVGNRIVELKAIQAREEQ